MVHFVGAGPGAKDLITVRGLSYIREADVIIYAGSLVNPELLKEAKSQCSIYDSAYMTLEEVLDVMYAAEAEGLMTVRLHTGDPSIYGAIREQMDELSKKGISYDVCPGVSSMSGAAASLRAEYTLPEVSQSIIITRAEGRTKVPSGEELSKMAAHHATMILFLSSGLAKKVKEDLMAGGYEPDTPTAVVYKATWQEEKIIRTVLERLPEEMEREGIHKTALIIVGNVLDGAYEKSKLYDKTFTTEFRKGKEEGI
ncbi:MAG: precorrin-4 C(11)-methyltransferase [Lachnospiraceae bacterium]|nr:precorrin-4 C(11)-methyltransferase [Lachnospiraceae bacterium]